MLSRLFLGMSLLGAEWVLYILLLISVLSIALIFERILYYRAASRELAQFRSRVRETVAASNWTEARRLTEARSQEQIQRPRDLETSMAHALISSASDANSGRTPEILTERARDALVRGKVEWDRNLSVLATIGSNAPFVGLFGTVLGIIKAFHDLSQLAGQGTQAVSTGISEALVATAVGLLVAIPAVVAFNLFQRKVKNAMSEAEALKSFLISQIAKG